MHANNGRYATINVAAPLDKWDRIEKWMEDNDIDIALVQEMKQPKTCRE